MYSLLLPSCFCDRSYAEQPVPWRRRTFVVDPWVRDVLRAGAVSLLRTQEARTPASKWSLV